MNEPDTQEVAVTCPFCMKQISAKKTQVDEAQVFYENRCEDCLVTLTLCVQE